MSIALFRIMNDIARENGISQLQWGEASGVPQPRISELLRQVGAKEVPKGSRYFTLSRYIALYRGLRLILGEEPLKKALLKKADQEPDVKVRIWAKLAAILEEEDEKNRQIVVDLERYLDLLNK
jgi:hypothetical protein